MPTLLVVEVSPRAQYSTSRNLTARFVDRWKADYPGGQVVTRDLVTSEVPFVNLPWIGGAYTPAEQHSSEMRDAIEVSNRFVAELLSADEILIGTPMYNFSIPALLKAYIDHIVRVGVTFTPDYKGLVTGKKARIIISSGGDYSAGSHAESMNAASSYLRQILGFIGISDVDIVLAGRALAVDKGETTMEQFVDKYDEALSLAAAA